MIQNPLPHDHGQTIEQELEHMPSVESFPYFDFSQTHWGVRKFLYGEGLMLTVRQYEKPPAPSPRMMLLAQNSI